MVSLGRPAPGQAASPPWAPSLTPPLDHPGYKPMLRSGLCVQDNVKTELQKLWYDLNVCINK